MVKNKILSVLFGVAGIILLVASLYLAISYLSYIGKVMIDFFSSNNIQTISECGVVIPHEFTEIRDQMPSTILPAVYLGIPLTVLLISILMFFSGYYLGRHKVESELDAHLQREEEIEKEVKKRKAVEEKEEEEGKKEIKKELKKQQRQEGEEEKPPKKKK